MEYYCTICSKEKKSKHGLLPAIERYDSSRIRSVYQEGKQKGVPMIILSGKHGLLSPQDKIEWYDHMIEPEDLLTLITKITYGLHDRNVTKLVFFARERTSPGWELYYSALEITCANLGIPITYVLSNY